MLMHRTAPYAGVAFLLAAGALPAQLPESQVHAAGLGAQKQVIDAEAASGDNFLLGVVYLNGEYFVTGTQTTNQVYVLGEDGMLKRKFAQSATSTLGFRDGATDGKSLMFGWENGVSVIDVNGAAVNTVVAANGPQTITQPIKAPTSSGVSTHRALAYDPNGNNGNGSIWTANFGSPLIEIDLTGKVLTRHVNGSGWSLYGLAWDPHTNTLLGNSVPNAGDIAQIDPATGMTTGIGFSRNQPGSAQGGLSAVPSSQNPGGGGWDVVGLDQGTPDTITRYRVHLYTQPLRSGYDETRLLSASGGGMLNDNPIKTMVPDGTISFKIAGDFLKRPAWAVVNFGDDALKNGVTQHLPELVALNPASTPSGIATFFRAFGGSTVTFRVPGGLKDCDYLRVQAVTINPGGLSALTATNQVFFKLDASKVTVEAVGSNSFNSNRNSGYFRVIHNSGSAIASTLR